MDDASTRWPELDSVLLRRRLEEIENLLVTRYRLWKVGVGAFFSLDVQISEILTVGPGRPPGYY